MSIPACKTSIPAESVLFIASGSLAMGKLVGNQCIDWASGTIALVQPEGSSKVALCLVDSANRKHSLVSEISCDMAIALVDERARLFGWTVGEKLYRVHLQDDDRRRFLSLVCNFTLALDSACYHTQNTQDQYQFYLDMLPSDLSQLQGAIVNSVGRLERLEPEPVNPIYFEDDDNEQPQFGGYPQSPKSEDAHNGNEDQSLLL